MGREGVYALLPARVEATIRLSRLNSNFARICANAARASDRFAGAVAMVKGNAYGHGLIEVSRALARESKLTAFGVASLDEAARLRAAGLRKPVWVFSGAGPFSENTAAICVRHGLTPVIYTTEDLRRCLRACARNPSLQFHLKFNTGMNRLGIDPADFASVLNLFGAAGGGAARFRSHVKGICTHLASADESPSQTSRQIEIFRALTRACFAVAYIHCANSATSVSSDLFGTGAFCNLIRPGIGLYGYAGAAGARLGLQPVLELRARVLQSRSLRRGDRVGYGGTYSARAGEREAVVASGYGDGLHRALSNREILISTGGKALRAVSVLGRVSMDMTSLGAGLKPGSWVTLLGMNQRQGERMASEAGTIIYEILTSLTDRVARIYR
ncbi:MAG: alanine racemase [Deltaproteobacteria bacterium]|nr:alanine racemase [Deltaproteobacteria bacterium]